MVKNQIDIFPSSRSTRHVRYVSTHGHVFKVPADQRRANPDAYEPHLFSFGLYHAVIPTATTAIGGADDANAESSTAAAAASKAYGDAYSQFRCSVDEGDHLKLLFAKALLGDDALRALVDSIQEHDAELREFYIQMPPVILGRISASSLALRLVLDGITLVAAALNPELLWRNDAPMIYHITRLALSDAILLENQVPIFILSIVIKTLPVRPAADRSPHVSNGSYLFLEEKLQQVLDWYRERASPFPNFTRAKNLHVDAQSAINPLLCYIYNYLIEEVDLPHPQGSSSSHLGRIHSENPSLPPHMVIPIEDKLEDPWLPSASHLAKCGVKFRACNAGFQGISFSRSCVAAELRIPRIAVSDNTVRSLHNLIAYEATTRYPEESFVISFVHFMDCLIDTEEDVSVLVDAGVIRNVLGSHEEVASMWNKLGISVNCRMTKKDRKIMAELEALAKRRWRRWWASFKGKYWEKQPWLIASIIAAVILLVLTLVQTIYAMKGFNVDSINPAGKK